MTSSVPLIPVELDRTRNLRLDLNAMVQYETISGKPFTSITSITSVTDLRTIMWAMLVHEDPELTQEQVGAMIHVGNIDTLFGKTALAQEVASPDAPPEPNREEKRAAAKNRSRSTG